MVWLLSLWHSLSLACRQHLKPAPREARQRRGERLEGGPGWSWTAERWNDGCDSKFENIFPGPRNYQILAGTIWNHKDHFATKNHSKSVRRLVAAKRTKELFLCFPRILWLESQVIKFHKNTLNSSFKIFTGTVAQKKLNLLHKGTFTQDKNK